MFVTNNGTIQKEMVTEYNELGKLIRRSWFWNGETKFHNSETFFYNAKLQLINIVDSFVDGNTETTTIFYTNSIRNYSVTTSNNNDTIYSHIYPNENTDIKCWYQNGNPYRYDTTIFEKENVKIEYYGIENSTKWHYKFKNNFDAKGNLTRIVFNSKVPSNTFTKYFYYERGLLLRKEEGLLRRRMKKYYELFISYTNNTASNKALAHIGA